MCCSARSTSVPRSRARGIPPATGSAAPGSPPAAACRQCYNTAADGESLKSVPESFAVGGIRTALPAAAVKGGVRCALLCDSQDLLFLRDPFEFIRNRRDKDLLISFRREDSRGSLTMPVFLHQHASPQSDWVSLPV